MLKDAVSTIGRLIDAQKIAFIGSADSGGFPNIKAMLAPREREGIQTLWFSTNTSSQHVAQYRADPRACVYFCDRRFFRGAMLLGTMQVLEDAESKQKLWQKGDTQYYKLGVDDPDYCVLKFTAQSGRYYSNFKSTDFGVE